MNLFGTGAAGVLGSGSTPWLLISLGLGLVVLGMWCRKKFFPRNVGAGDGQRPHRILPGFPRRDDLRVKDRVAGRGVIPFRAHTTLQPCPGDGEKEKTSIEEESAMRTPERTFRKVTYLLLALTISAALAACGSGGGSTSSTPPGVAGPATVSVSVASAPSYPAGTTFATSTSSPTTAAAPANSPDFDNVIVTVTKLALIPSSGAELPDPNGELETQDSPSEKGKGFVTDSFSPVTFDLLHPNSSSGDNVATLLNKFTGVPAGEYSKIRVYYDSVIGQPGNKLFHPTAHYHFDVHFVGGNLVIPEATDPEGGIRFYSVEINVVGLKYHEAGQSGNVLLRPQVFAKMVGAPRYIVTGVAEQVDHGDGTFVIKAVNDNISAAYGSGTRWFYVDGRFVGPFGSSGAEALQNTALVDVIGTFQGSVLVAEEVDITFPNVRHGKADNVWIPPDNTAFIVRSLSDNVTVFPRPDRYGAYYDNLTSPYNQLDNTYIGKDLCIRARGYFDDLNQSILSSYWISIGDLISPCP